MINYELDGKVAVVTGGASGIGLACAHALARSGATVCLWDLKGEALEAGVAELEQYGRPTSTATVDVSDSGQVNGAMEDVADALGRVDVVVANAGIGGEQKPTAEYSDASWHQVIIRDTSFTPSHVVVFYGSFPMYIVCGVASYLYAMTRLPLYSRGTSFPLVMAIAGPLMILPNVGLNEWGHAFWFMEELFSAPLHWGFVILGWSGLFSGGIAAQIITRYSNLTDVIWNGQSKVILNNRIVP